MNRLGRQCVGLCVVIFALSSVIGSTNAQAIGVLRLESNGFLRNSTDRANSSQTVSVGPRLSNDGDYIESALDVDGIVMVSDQSTFTIEGSNGYVATSKKLSERFQTTVGRRAYDWSTMDDFWEFGLHSPRFIWDPTRPQKIGLTGIFQTYQRKNFELRAYASPLSIPERGFPTREENGLIKSSNPFYTPLYEFVNIQDRIVPVRYDIRYPPMSDLLVNPGGMLSLRVQNSPEKGAWMQITGAHLPIHQVKLNVETDQAYDPLADQVEVKVFPEILMHTMLTFETGVKARRFSLWGSVTQEIPEKKDYPSTWMSAQTENALIASIGAEIIVSRKVLFKTSFLHIDEDPTKKKADEDEITVDLPSRFPFKRATRTELEIYGNSRMTYLLGWTHDFQFESDIFSLDATYQLSKKDNTLTLNAGADFFASETSKGYIGQYRGNDRVRGAIAYAF